jgi:hypothetical protein
MDKVKGRRDKIIEDRRDKVIMIDKYISRRQKQEGNKSE